MPLEVDCKAPIASAQRLKASVELRLRDRSHSFPLLWSLFSLLVFFGALQILILWRICVSCYPSAAAIAIAAVLPAPLFRLLG